MMEICINKNIAFFEERFPGIMDIIKEKKKTLLNNEDIGRMGQCSRWTENHEDTEQGEKLISVRKKKSYWSCYKPD